MDVIDFTCGLFSGWSQIIVGHPFDFIKTKYQTSNDLQKGKISFLKFAKQIYHQHGLFGFYRGASSLLFGNSFIIGIQFTIYQGAKKFLKQRNYPKSSETPEEILKIWEIGLSGMLVGFFVSFIYCPVEYAKIKKQTSGNMKKGSFMFLVEEMKKTQLKNIYQGLTATLVRQSFGTIVYFGMYEQTVRWICELQNRKRKFAEYYDYLIGGGVAGLAFWTVIYPCDVVKTRVQSGSSYKQAFENIIQTSYRGFGNIAFRSVLVNAVGFATFEQFKGAFNLLRLTAMH